jgi:hypothetical protein
MTSNKADLYGGLVWIISSLSLLLYGILGFTNQNIPGLEDLITYLSSANNSFIYVAAFLSIFIEGIYIVGSFFPGSTLVVLLSIFSQINGIKSFIVTIIIIYIGWCLAGVINVLATKFYGSKILKKTHNDNYIVKDRSLITWFPAFRANYEVSQIMEGGGVYKVLLSSFRVKLQVSLIMFIILLLLPLLIDVQKLSNKEGILSVLTVAAITFIVGVIKIHKYFINKPNTSVLD